MRTRSTTPLRLFSLPIGSSIGITFRPNALISDSSTRSAFARSRSMRFTTINLGVLYSSQSFHTRCVTTSTPATPSTTTIAASTTGSAILASWTNMLNPGVSRMLIFVVPADVPQSLGRPGGEQHGRHERGLARVPVSDHRYISNVCSGIDFQVGLLRQAREGNGHERIRTGISGQPDVSHEPRLPKLWMLPRGGGSLNQDRKAFRTKPLEPGSAGESDRALLDEHATPPARCWLDRSARRAMRERRTR